MTLTARLAQPLGLIDCEHVRLLVRCILMARSKRSLYQVPLTVYISMNIIITSVAVMYVAQATRVKSLIALPDGLYARLLVSGIVRILMAISTEVPYQSTLTTIISQAILVMSRLPMVLAKMSYHQLSDRGYLWHQV